MSISKELLLDFQGSVAGATDAPDSYPLPEYQSYDKNKADLQFLWSQIRPQIQRDIDRRDMIDAKLQEAFTAFESGDKERGVDAIMAIYNSKVTTLR